MAEADGVADRLVTLHQECGQHDEIAKIDCTALLFRLLVKRIDRRDLKALFRDLPCLCIIGVHPRSHFFGEAKILSCRDDFVFRP